MRLQALSPQIALQLITASEGSEARSRGVRMIPGVLTGNAGRAVMSFPALKMSRGVFLETLRAHLSAAEQVPGSLPPLPNPILCGSVADILPEHCT